MMVRSGIGTEELNTVLFMCNYSYKIERVDKTKLGGVFIGEYSAAHTIATI